MPKHASQMSWARAPGLLWKMASNLEPEDTQAEG